MRSEKERRYLSDDKDLPVVLVHGTMGKSEDWSRVVAELSNFRLVLPDTRRERIFPFTLTVCSQHTAQRISNQVSILCCTLPSREAVLSLTAVSRYRLRCL
jgi:hypothetical protein